MKIWMFLNSYYIGEDKFITDKAIKSEEIEIPQGKKIVVSNGILSFVDEDNSYN